MSSYSSFFTVGLYLTAKGRDSSAAPIALPLSSTSVSGSSTITDTAPKTSRRRRSSLTISILPISALKSPLRSATLAKQQATIRSPVRERSGHILHSQPPHPVFFDGHDVRPAVQEPSRSASSTVFSRVRGRLALPSLTRPAPTAPLPDLPFAPALSNVIPDSPLTTMPSRTDSPLLTVALREPLSPLPCATNASSVIATPIGTPLKHASGDHYIGRPDLATAMAEVDDDPEKTKENVQSI